MTQRKNATPTNEPIVLSGSVFLDGILAEDNPRARMPARLEVGDIRLHNVNKPGERPRFGEKVTFSGFIVASVWNGKKFRRFLLRKRGAIEPTYVGPAARRERAVALMSHLSTLVRRQAFWYSQDSGYEVPRDGIPLPAADTTAAPAATKSTSTAVAATPAPQAVTPPPPVAAAPADVAVTVTVKVEVAGQGVVAAMTARSASTHQHRRRKVAADEKQLPLFPEQDQTLSGNAKSASKTGAKNG
ncbi:MAG: hypothetical protein P4L53_23825 [Candidatus Obscuribacterales bacterium]|nr:hypothetical protein [Candidatus Obscuribacterales bacterium]